jgi:hypothetical protein
MPGPSLKYWWIEEPDWSTLIVQPRIFESPDAGTPRIVATQAAAPASSIFSPTAPATPRIIKP